MTAELVTLFLYGAVLSSLLIYSIHWLRYDQSSDLMTASDGKEENNDTTMKFHDQDTINSDATLTMSADKDQQGDIISCSSSKISEDEDTHFKTCDACDLVQCCSCSDDCQTEHRPSNEESCVERAAEVRDKTLFQQPKTTHLGDCPI